MLPVLKVFYIFSVLKIFNVFLVGRVFCVFPAMKVVHPGPVLLKRFKCVHFVRPNEHMLYLAPPLHPEPSHVVFGSPTLSPSHHMLCLASPLILSHHVLCLVPPFILSHHVLCLALPLDPEPSCVVFSSSP